jgi:hypothetical protein
LGIGNWVFGRLGLGLGIGVKDWDWDWELGIGFFDGLGISTEKGSMRLKHKCVHIFVYAYYAFSHPSCFPSFFVCGFLSFSFSYNKATGLFFKRTHTYILNFLFTLIIL